MQILELDNKFVSPTCASSYLGYLKIVSIIKIVKCFELITHVYMYRLCKQDLQRTYSCWQGIFPEQHFAVGSDVQIWLESR